MFGLNVKYRSARMWTFLIGFRDVLPAKQLLIKIKARFATCCLARGLQGRRSRIDIDCWVQGVCVAVFAGTPRYPPYSFRRPRTWRQFGFGAGPGAFFLKAADVLKMNPARMMITAMTTISSMIVNSRSFGTMTNDE